MTRASVTQVVLPSWLPAVLAVVCRVQHTAQHSEDELCRSERGWNTLNAGLSGYMEEELAEVLSVLTKTHKRHIDLLTETRDLIHMLKVHLLKRHVEKKKTY